MDDEKLERRQWYVVKKDDKAFSLIIASCVRGQSNQADAWDSHLWFFNLGGGQHVVTKKGQVKKGWVSRKLTVVYSY